MRESLSARWVNRMRALRCDATSNPSAAYAAVGLGQRSVSMATPDTLRYTRIPLAHGSGAIPAVGFGTLIPDPVATKEATKTALEVGFRHFNLNRPKRLTSHLTFRSQAWSSFASGTRNGRPT